MRLAQLAGEGAPEGESGRCVGPALLDALHEGEDAGGRHAWALPIPCHAISSTIIRQLAYLEYRGLPVLNTLYAA
jgi:hypothetical protein